MFRPFYRNVRKNFFFFEKIWHSNLSKQNNYFFINSTNAKLLLCYSERIFPTHFISTKKF